MPSEYAVDEAALGCLKKGESMFDFSRYLHIRSAYAPTISADGSSVAFITNITGIPQVWRVAPEGGWPEQLTFFGERVSSVSYAPVGDRLLFGMDVGGSERTQLFLLDERQARTIALTEGYHDSIHYFSSQGGGWSPDGKRIAFTANRRNQADFDVYIQDVEGDELQEARLVLEGKGTRLVVGWGPNSDWLLLLEYHTPANQDVYKLDLNDGSLTLLTPHEGDVRYQQILLSPDGTLMYCATDRDSDVLRAAELTIATGEWQILTDEMWDVDGLSLSPDGSVLAIILNEGGRSQWKLIETVSRSELPPPPLPLGMVYSGISWTPDGSGIVFDYTGPQHNTDIWFYSFDESLIMLLEQTRNQYTPVLPRSSRLLQVTRSSHAGIPRRSFVVPELIHYSSFDGRAIPAWLYLPKGAERKAGQRLDLPMLIEVHGGPEGQRRVEFNLVYQYFLSRGYGILAPNVRGSTGYGKAYEKLDNVELRPHSVADLAHAAIWLSETGIADPKRIAVMGGSYGGYMVLAALTNYPELWAAGIDIVGIANLETFLEQTGEWRRHLREAEYGSLERDRELLRALSPIYKVDRIRAPLMVIHGANDPRVPIGEAEQIVRSLRERDHPVEYLRFEDEGHGIVKLHNRLVCYPAIARFLETYLKS